MCPTHRTTTKNHISAYAVVHPPCLRCNQPYSWHVPNNHYGKSGCIGYWPSRPIDDYGIRALDSDDRLIRLIWWVEKRLQGWRERRLRSLRELR